MFPLNGGRYATDLEWGYRDIHRLLHLIMSDTKFANKVLNGEIINNEDWSEHLMEAHRISPRMTPLAFAPYKTSQGKNSYELLADCVVASPSKNIHLLDLACGDGHLIPYLL